MKQQNQPLEDIRIIKKIMEESSRFLSLSGLSGVSAGIVAIAGAAAAWVLIPGYGIRGEVSMESFKASPEGHYVITRLLLVALTVLILALISAFYFSLRKARKDAKKLWTPVTKKMLINLALPLATGGLFILITLGKIPGTISVASTLIFYGLALINGGKFTFGEIYWLGLIEVFAGMVCLVLPATFTLLIWTLGFGVLHIVYGLFMFLRYR